jgi:ubiquinone biosynthesis protein COQ4
MRALHRPTSNPFKIAAAAWRLIKDLSNTEDALLVEMTFFRSRMFRKYARWDEAAAALREDPRTRNAFKKRPRVGDLDVQFLSQLPPGSLGQVVGSQFLAKGLSPYLFEPVADHSDGDYVMAHILETHDIWHAVTGLDTDVAGEFALTAFYAAQTGLTSSSMLLTFGLANTTLFAPAEIRERLSAVARGWTLGANAEPLFGTDWASLWEVPLAELRARFGLSDASGEADSRRDQGGVQAPSTPEVLEMQSMVCRQLSTHLDENPLQSDWQRSTL